MIAGISQIHTTACQRLPHPKGENKLFKKTISLFIILAMLVPFSSAVAADEPNSQPSIEEILNRYYEKAFAAQIVGENDNTSTYSRSSSGKSQTLQQDTVTELTAAGYEAYQVTSDNFDDLEALLNTDFDSMGLKRDYSYIVVVHGDPNTSANKSNTRGYEPPSEDYFDGPDNNAFFYQYQGQSYSMRYITVTTDPKGDLVANGHYALNYDEFSDVWLTILDSVLTSAIEELVEPFRIGSIISLLTGLGAEQLFDHNYTALETNTLHIISTSIWTLDCIQVWDLTSGTWETKQISYYARSSAYATGYLYNSDTHSSERFVGDEVHWTTYSQNFNNHDLRRKNAAIHFDRGFYPSYDRTGDIDFYLMDSSGTVNYCGEGVPLFSHTDYT